VFHHRAGRDCQLAQIGKRGPALELVLHPVEGREEEDQGQTDPQAYLETQRTADEFHGRTLSQADYGQLTGIIPFHREGVHGALRKRYHLA